MRSAARRPVVRQAAGALLLLSVGIVVGTYVPARGSAAPAETADARPRAADTAAASPAHPAPVASAPAPAAPEASVPPAPGYEPFLAGSPAPGFGGEYAVLRGAQTAGDPVPQASPPPPPTIPSAPTSPVQADTTAAGPAARTAPPAPAARTAPPAPAAPEPFRPSPARGIPRGVALRYPLLAIARPGGRVAFHDLGVASGPTPAGIEGEWAVIGRCDRTVRLDFALPSRRAGELRAIGRADAAGGWSVEPVVARQACAPAAERYQRPHPPTEEERVAFGPAGAGAGFVPGDLAQVGEARGSVLLVFRRAGAGSAVVAAARGPGGPVLLWSHAAAPGDGDLSLVGVYRTGAGAEVWIIIGHPGAPRALLGASSPDGRTWSSLAPIPLRDP